MALRPPRHRRRVLARAWRVPRRGNRRQRRRRRNGGDEPVPSLGGDSRLVVVAAAGGAQRRSRNGGGGGWQRASGGRCHATGESALERGGERRWRRPEGDAGASQRLLRPREPTVDLQEVRREAGGCWRRRPVGGIRTTRPVGSICIVVVVGGGDGRVRRGGEGVVQQIVKRHARRAHRTRRARHQRRGSTEGLGCRRALGRRGRTQHRGGELGSGHGVERLGRWAVARVPAVGRRRHRRRHQRRRRVERGRVATAGGRGGGRRPGSVEEEPGSAPRPITATTRTASPSSPS